MIDPASLELPRDTELRDRLISWCDINTGSDNTPGLERMRAVLAGEFASLPCEVTAIDLGPGKPRGVRAVCRPDARMQVLLNGHFDTVYGPAHPSQKCELVDHDKLRGPGVIDDKGGILVLFTALQAFEQTPHAKNIGWEVILGPDEETGSATTAPFYKHAAPRFHFGMIFEPARENGDLVRARMGTGIYTATCRGRAAHAGRDPEAGRNAILALAGFLLDVGRIPNESPGIMVNVGRIEGGGAVNIVPDLAVAGINARVSTADDARRLESRLAELAAAVNAREGYRLEIGGGFNRGPLEPTPGRQALFDAYCETGRALSFEFGWRDVAGGSDGNILGAAGLTCIDGIGAHGDCMHSDREWVRISSIAERARLAALFLARLAAGEITLPASITSRSLAR